MKLISQMSVDDLRAWKPAKVDLKTIRDIAAQIAREFNPVKIILFGSYARGEADARSDIDLLVIMESAAPPHIRALPVYNLLADYLLPVEVIVRTPEETTWYQDVPSSFIQTILREGVTLHEKPSVLSLRAKRSNLITQLVNEFEIASSPSVPRNDDNRDSLARARNDINAARPQCVERRS